ncbi:MAG: hypothetical protein AAGA56_24815, partial [Myxococcota bacterium]
VDIDIPAGEANASFATTFRNWSDAPVTVSGFAGHMHLLGTAIRAELESTADALQCGLSIPNWDFDWQLTYDPDEPLVVQPGDGIRVTCEYDNSPANQPVVDGVQLEPRDVQWGEGSLDEMCLMYVTVVEPYVPSAPPATEGGACASANDCFAASDGSLSSLLACEASSTECLTCALGAGRECGLTPCLVSLASERARITDCVVSVNAFGGSLDRCVRGTCGDAYSAFLGCADPIVQQGDCNEAFANACGLGGETPP